MNISNNSVGLIIEYLNEADRAIISLINKRLNKIELNTNCYYEKECHDSELKLLNNKHKNVHVIASSLDYLNDNKNIKSITFGWDFNQKIENLPYGLTYLAFGECFDQKIEDLPNTLTHLTFGWKFNQKIENLPKQLTHLTFGGMFNQKIENLPNTLTHLTFNWYSYFNQKIEDLPNTLKHLTFGYYFDQKIENLPKTLTYLKISRHYKQKLEVHLGCIIDRFK
jgi:hypothetical protein